MIRLGQAITLDFNVARLDVVLGHSTFLYHLVHFIFGVLFLQTVELVCFAIVKVIDTLLISVSILILGISSLEHNLISFQMGFRVQIRRYLIAAADIFI